MVDETTIRILDTLARSLGKPLSINELTNKIRQLHGTAYYANTYRKLHDLSERGIITLTKTGKSSIPTLNFDKYLLIDMLAAIDIERKPIFFEKHTELQMLIMEIETYCIQLSFIKSISVIHPERNKKLNRVELLILLHELKDAQMREQISNINQLIKRLQLIHIMRIDYLILNSIELRNLLSSEERNPLKEMLSDKMTFLHPQDFWMTIKQMWEQGFRIKFEDKETNPTKISDQELTYNLTRLGYREFGLKSRRTDSICIEYIITSILMSNEARRITAVPIILVKNKTNYNLLIFLAQKYKFSGKLLGLLRVLNRNRPKKEIEEAVKRLEALNVKEIKADEESIIEKMRVYNA